MICVVNWIPLRIRVRSRNIQPHQKYLPGPSQITRWIVLTQKSRGCSGEKNSPKSRNSCRLSGGGVGAHWQLCQGSNDLIPGTKYKRSKDVFFVTCIVLTFARLCTQLFTSLLSFMCRRTTSRLVVYPHACTRVDTSKKSDPRHCALQMCSIARNFTHQANIYVSWTAALLNPGFSASSAQHLGPSTKVL